MSALGNPVGDWIGISMIGGGLGVGGGDLTTGGVGKGSGTGGIDSGGIDFGDFVLEGVGDLVAFPEDVVGDLVAFPEPVFPDLETGEEKYSTHSQGISSGYVFRGNYEDFVLCKHL